MTEKEERELDEKIDKMAVEMEKETAEREKETKEDKELNQLLEKEMEEDKELNQLLKETLIDISTPFCHYIKLNDVVGKEFMAENTLLRHCVGCNDEEQCWNVG